jgi:hypothetical protein
MEVEYLSISPVPSVAVQFVSQFRVTEKPRTKQPKQIILYLSIDKEKAGINCCEIPVYIPAYQNYCGDDHMRMLEQFRKGAPFVPVCCRNLKVYKTESGYFGYAESFSVIEPQAAYELLKEVLE